MINKLESVIESFEIFGLFGEQTITISFESDVKIIVGENGIGKTTILNALFYTLTCDFYNLSTIEFNKIVLKFRSGNSVIIENEDLKFIPNDDSRFMFDLKRILTQDEILSLLNHVKQKDHINRHPLFRKIIRSIPVSPSFLVRKLSEYTENNYDIFERVKNTINNEIPFEIIYFPTYRRIEEDLHNLGFEYDPEKITKSKGKLIQFGMSDVTSKFNHITSIIKDSAIEGFSRVTGEMLRQLVDGINITQKMQGDIKQPDALKIVLERVGNNITPSDKRHIIQLIESGEISHPKYDPLIYLLSNLIKIYDQQREKDNSIKRFAAICNKYLVNKEVVYNENTVEIKIVQKSNSQPVQINKLSSGEKQIVSLFSKIFLDVDREFIFIFDEPELSLSIEWQKELLPDIWNSKKCNQLIIATHSPFIFDNEFDNCAVALDHFVRRWELENEC